ncbi:MAG TPA: D-2-hydroxyacid dehydrogenase family protein [Dehalococcoidia bacterium]|nr:D-2-hydroxyacid dehydrogenase family protein [Dehalococcoidia bacterium]
MTRIAVLDDYQGVALSSTDWSRLPADARVEVFRNHLFDQDALAQRLAPFEVICAMRERTPFPGSLLRRLPNLKLLLTTGARNASFDMPAIRELGITVCGTMGGPRGTTSELTWALILALAKKVPQEDADVRRGGWQIGLGESLDGKTLGVIGLGNLGSHVAAVGKAFNMNVIAWSQNLTEERAAQFGARLVTKGELLTQSDYVTIHLVLSDRSRGLIGANDLALMKPTAYLINTSRGPIVDEVALIDALRNKRIAGAGLDVFDIEPLPLDHPLRKLENTVITPHLGYVTAESYRSFFDQTVENILGYLEGKPVRLVE